MRKKIHEKRVILFSLVIAILRLTAKKSAHCPLVIWISTVLDTGRYFFGTVTSYPVFISSWVVVVVLTISAAEALSKSRNFVLLLIFYYCNHIPVLFGYSRPSLLVFLFLYRRWGKCESLVAYAGRSPASLSGIYFTFRLYLWLERQKKKCK